MGLASVIFKSVGMDLAHIILFSLEAHPPPRTGGARIIPSFRAPTSTPKITAREVSN